MTAPIIGITSNLIPARDGNSVMAAVGEAYVQSIVRAGGAPVILPVGLPDGAIQDLLSQLDGLLLTGGGDIDPGRFDGAVHPRVYGIEPRRDELEIRLVQSAAGQGMPFLGICRGIQVMNVALGGSLYTDLADQLPGSLKHDHFPGIPRDYLAHPVAVSGGSRLEGILEGDTIPVNSLHHQGIDRLAPGLHAAAYSPDGLIEAIELEGHPFGIGVQWHPECLPDLPPQRRLFQALVAAAQNRERR